MPASDQLGTQLVAVRWVANPWRGDKFEALWGEVAEAALDYGATAYAFFRSKEDQSVFIQLTFGLESKLDWERYWLSDEVSDARARATGLFQVPVTPEWQRLVGFDSRALAAVGD